jgi:hypothetical protein
MDFGSVPGEWSGYSLQVLGLLRASASLWAFRCYPYPDGGIKNWELKIKNRDENKEK